MARRPTWTTTGDNDDDNQRPLPNDDLFEARVTASILDRLHLAVSEEYLAELSTHGRVSAVARAHGFAHLQRAAEVYVAAITGGHADPDVEQRMVAAALAAMKAEYVACRGRLGSKKKEQDR